MAQGKVELFWEGAWLQAVNEEGKGSEAAGRAWVGLICFQPYYCKLFHNTTKTNFFYTLSNNSYLGLSNYSVLKNEYSQ